MHILSPCLWFCTLYFAVWEWYFFARLGWINCCKFWSRVASTQGIQWVSALSSGSGSCPVTQLSANKLFQKLDAHPLKRHWIKKKKNIGNSQIFHHDFILTHKRYDCFWHKNGNSQIFVQFLEFPISFRQNLSLKSSYNCE